MNLAQSGIHQKATSSLANFYLFCFIVSVVVSWGIASQFFLWENASLTTFFQTAFANAVSTLISSDILLSALIFLFFAYKELKRLGMPVNRLALYLLLTCSIGICASLSMFLYQRERWITRSQYQ